MERGEVRQQNSQHVFQADGGSQVDAVGAGTRHWHWPLDRSPHTGLQLPKHLRRQPSLGRQFRSSPVLPARLGLHQPFTGGPVDALD